ncbi:MAG: hypothetical protein IT340_22210 [Chloroflexi bacterium]|nr:hypothetical protein [Chloroflexota bacterium]
MMLRTGWMPPPPAHQVAAIVGDALLRLDGGLVAILGMEAPDHSDGRHPAFLAYVGHALAVLDEDVTCAIECGDEPLTLGPWCAIHETATVGEAHPQLRRLAACLRGFLRMHADEGLMRRRSLISLAVPGGPSRRRQRRSIELPASVVARLDAQVEGLTQQMQPAGIRLTRLDGTELALLLTMRLHPGRTIRAHHRVSHLGWRHVPAAAASE